MASEVEELDRLCGDSHREIDHRLCHQHLTAVTRGHDACRPMDSHAGVIATTQYGLADVDADPDTKPHARRPGMRGQCPLRDDGRVDRLAGGWEDGEDRIALAGDDRPAVLADGPIE